MGRKYSKVKEVNRLIKFFRDVPIQNYIYIYPYNEQFMEVKGNIQKYLEIYPYEIQMIVPGQKVIKGEKDKQKRKCIIRNESLSSFVKTIDWLRYGNDNIQLPDVVLFKCKRLILEPKLYIFTRKKLCDYRIPYCYGELRILDTIFVFIIPFTENDKYDFVDEKECRIFLEMLRNRYGRYETENFSSIVPRKIEEQCLISKQII